MKTLILPFVFFLTFVLSCREDDITEGTQKTVAAYDVYVSGKENNQLCYWKNGIKHTISNSPGESGPSKLFIYGNDVYIKGRYGYWKNGNYTTYFQAANLINQSGIDIFDFYVKNGNIYFVGYTWINNSPPADKYEFCYWKNGVKTLLFKDSYMYNDMCTITEFNSDVYVGAQKNINGVENTGYFKNTVFYPVPTNFLKLTEVISNENNVYFTSMTFYKNLITGVQTSFIPTPATAKYKPALDFNDVYINGGHSTYYKNANIIFTPNIYSIINDLKVTDQNIYMIRTNNAEFKVCINDVVTQSIQSVNNNSSFNNITVVKL